MRQNAPPSLHGLLQWLDQGADFREFVRLTRQYLPEHAAEILGEAGVNVQIATFAQRFGERYFDLMDEFTDGMVEEYEYLTACIPIQPLGISWDDYHDLTGWRPGYQLLLVLPQDPTVDPGRQGPRVALLDSCSEFVPAALLHRIGQGYTREQLHQRLDGTKFEAAALAADWLCGDTSTTPSWTPTRRCRSRRSGTPRRCGYSRSTGPGRGTSATASTRWRSGWRWSRPRGSGSCWTA